MHKWQKIAIALDVILALLLIGLEVLIFKGYKKRKNAA